MLGERPLRILGIDFSGAADAGRKIWIAQGTIRRGRLHVESCRSAVDLFGCAARPESSCAALVAYLRQLGPSAVGCDFPFSLPAQTIPETTWAAFLRGFTTRYPGAAAFHTRTHRQWGEPRRACDRAAATPFAPNNLRLYRQTYHGIGGVLAPLVAAGDARALPLQAPRPGIPWLLECCPASALKALGLYRPYKGTRADQLRQRLHILQGLSAAGLAQVPGELRRTLLTQSGGDALDSVVAAWIAFRTVRDPSALWAGPTGWPPIEGFVYTGFPVRMDAEASTPAASARPRNAERRKGTASTR